MGLRDDAINQARLAQERTERELADKIKQLTDQLERDARTAVAAWAQRLGTTVTDVRVGQPQTDPGASHNRGLVTVEWTADGLSFKGWYRAYADPGATKPISVISVRIIVDDASYPANSKLEIGQALRGEVPFQDDSW
jgi:hypothetical protein